jgi:hypothetical protein
LKRSDATKESETSSPFDGGDAQLLAALHRSNIKANLYQAIICNCVGLLVTKPTAAVGLDISVKGFHENLEILKKRGAYYGRVNMRTGEKEDYTLGTRLS